MFRQVREVTPGLPFFGAQSGDRRQNRKKIQIMLKFDNILLFLPLLF